MSFSQGFIVDWKTTAAILANSGSDIQAEFFKAFTKEMFSWKTGCVGREMQLLEIGKNLTEDERNLLSCLGNEK